MHRQWEPNWRAVLESPLQKARTRGAAAVGGCFGKSNEKEMREGLCCPGATVGLAAWLGSGYSMPIGVGPLPLASSKLKRTGGYAL